MITRLGDACARHPRHLALAALGCGLVLAPRVEVAVVAGAGMAALATTVRRRAPPLALVALAALVPTGAAAGSWRLAAADHTELARHAGRYVEVEGHVVRRERASYGVRRARLAATRYRFSQGARWVPLDERVQLRSRGPALAHVSIGDELHAGGELALPRPGAGRFDYAAYLHRAGVHTVVHAEWVRPTGDRRHGARGVLDAFRRRAEAGVAAGLDPALGALARGMVLGADEDIPDAMGEDFKTSGLAHVLAVSGQNVALLAALAWPLLAATGLSRRGRLAGVAVLIALYVPLTGAGPSIMRAGVMGGAAVAAAYAGRPASRWYALLLAGVVTLGFDPRAWQDVGWQLSFAAVAGIFVLARPLTGLLRRVPEPLRTGAGLTIAATLATGPLMAFHFERVSLAALPANLAALPAIPLVMWIGMLSAAAAQVSAAPAEVLNGLNGFCLAWVAAVARWGARLPGAALEVRIRGPAQLAFAYAALAGLLAAAWKARSPAPVVAAAGLALAGAVALVPRAAGPPRAFTVTFLDVGQGDATLIQAPGGRAALVDGGPPGAGIVSKLRARGVERLDLVVLTHAQEDHQGGLGEVVSRLPVGVLLDGGHPRDGSAHRRIVALAGSRGARVVPAAAGQRFRLGNGLRFDVLAPPAAQEPRPGDDPNARAVVLHVSYRALDVLLPADAESDATAALALPPAEVLKVAHHGSEDEGIRGLLERVRPVAAVIPVGAANRFGHPHPATVAALRAAVPRVLRTDRDGDVAVTLARGGLAIRSQR